MCDEWNEQEIKERNPTKGEKYVCQGYEEGKR